MGLQRVGHDRVTFTFTHQPVFRRRPWRSRRSRRVWLLPASLCFLVKQMLEVTWLRGELPSSDRQEENEGAGLC